MAEDVIATDSNQQIEEYQEGSRADHGRNQAIDDEAGNEAKRGQNLAGGRIDSGYESAGQFGREILAARSCRALSGVAAGHVPTLTGRG